MKRSHLLFDLGLLCALCAVLAAGSGCNNSNAGGTTKTPADVQAFHGTAPPPSAQKLIAEKMQASSQKMNQVLNPQQPKAPGQ